MPFQPKKEISKYISILDVALVNLKKSDTFKTVIPSKIFENAAMAKPILLGVEGESKQIIEKYNAGVCFEPENEQDFLAKIDLLLDKEKYKYYQQNCSLLATDFNRFFLSIKMLNHIRKVLGIPAYPLKRMHTKIT